MIGTLFVVGIVAVLAWAAIGRPKINVRLGEGGGMGRALCSPIKGEFGTRGAC